VLIEHAIFTSIRSSRNEGYHLAARSPGVLEGEAAELSQWGPGHESLYDECATWGAVSYHRLQSGRLCVSRTVLAGQEYSGRGGARVSTHSFLVPDAVMTRFANNPFRVMEALEAAGRVCTAAPPRRLEPVPLVGRASAVNTRQLERVTDAIGAEKLATLLCAALRTPSMGTTATGPAAPLFACLLDLVPPTHRLPFSFSTGLRVSARRPYRLVMLPRNPEEQRTAIRLVHLTPVDLTSDVPSKFAPQSGWALKVYQLLKARRFQLIRTTIEGLETTADSDLDVLSEQLRIRDDEQDAPANVLTPFAASDRGTAGTGIGCHGDRPMPPGGIAR